MKSNNFSRIGCVFVFATCMAYAGTSLADVPVVDGNGADSTTNSSGVVTSGLGQDGLPDDSNTATGASASSAAAPALATSNLSMPQRVGRLEQQMNNLNQASLLNQIQTMHQQIQDLRGKLDVQQHQYDQLKQQQLTMYQDLNARIGGKKGKMAAIPPSSSSVNAGAASPDDSNGAAAVASVPSSPDASTASPSSPAKGDTAATDASSSVGNDSTASASSSSSDDQSLYQQGYQSIRSGNYNQAAKSLKSYLKQHPTGQYAARSHYWLGEIYYIQNNTGSAVKEFKEVVVKFPQDSKVPDAKLKLGFVYFDNGQLDQSKTYLTDVVKNYPKTPASQLATSRLKQIQNLQKSG